MLILLATVKIHRYEQRRRHTYISFIRIQPCWNQATPAVAQQVRRGLMAPGRASEAAGPINGVPRRRSQSARRSDAARRLKTWRASDAVILIVVVVVVVVLPAAAISSARIYNPTTYTAVDCRLSLLGTALPTF